MNCVEPACNMGDRRYTANLRFPLRPLPPLTHPTPLPLNPHSLHAPPPLTPFPLHAAVARGLALWWVVSAHTSSGEEVSRTLAALRGGANAPYAMGPLERAACWLALGALLQAEPPLHPAAANTQPAANTHAAAGGPAGAAAGHGGEGEQEAQAHYAFNVGDEGALRALVEAGNAAGLALGLQVLATAGMGECVG